VTTSNRRAASVSRPRGRALAVGVVLALSVAGLVGPSQAAAALKYKQPTCGKFQKKVNNSTGAKKRAAKRSLEQCKANMQVYKQVRNSHFVGTRSDGVEIDTQYCANGKWQDDVATGGRVGTNGWRIVDAKVKNKRGTRFTAVVEAWIPGGRFVQGLIRNGDQWQVGYEFGGEVKSPGDVEKTNARAACAAL
jgi:hypothetical protein